MSFNIEDYAFPELKPGDQDWRWCHKYCYDVIKGNIPSGLLIKQAAERHFRDIQNHDINPLVQVMTDGLKYDNSQMFIL